MPGPSNTKRKKKSQAKKQKRNKQRVQEQATATEHESLYSSSALPPLPPSPLDSPQSTTPPQHLLSGHDDQRIPHYDVSPSDTESRLRMQQYLESAREDEEEVPLFLRKPCVEDLGNGPRVRDIAAFLNSRIAAPPSFDDPLCAEFAQEEILEMLCTILPQETAMIMWYNKSRLRSRICPACQRLYHLGDSAREPFMDYEDDDILTEEEIIAQQTKQREESRKRFREQEISGICSALCFILVAHKYPAAIRLTYGRMAEDISDETWDELDGPGFGKDDKMGLSVLLKMTRCHDLGLGQLFLPDDSPEEESADEQQSPSDSE